MLSQYDIISFFEDEGIDYSTSGKNVTRNWVEINCPYSFCSDPSKHCGISLETGLHHCWICGSKGDFIKLTTKLLNISFSEAKQILKAYEHTPIIEKKEQQIKYDKSININAFTRTLPQLHKNYLISRNFDPDYISRKYKIRACYQNGKYSYRIIIPIFQNNTIVNFTARDVTGNQKVKYLNLHNDEAIIPMKNCVYNIDSVKSKIIICEGVFDVWRIGDEAVATMGIEYTSAQLKLISDKKIKKAIVLYDADASKKAEKLANALSIFINDIDIIYLDEGDPADLSEEKVKKILNF